MILTIFNEFYPTVNKNSLVTLLSQHFPLTPGPTVLPILLLPRTPVIITAHTLCSVGAIPSHPPFPVSMGGRNTFSVLAGSPRRAILPLPA